MPICQNCNKEFPNKIGKINTSKRKFCFECSPVGKRNTRTYIIKLQENEAFCARCKKTKPTKEFYMRKNGKPLSYCIECQQEIKNIKFEENLERISIEKGNICQDCGIMLPTQIYIFYSENNIYNLSKARNMSYEKLIKELEKYIMICRNCCALREWVKLS